MKNFIVYFVIVMTGFVSCKSSKPIGVFVNKTYPEVDYNDLKYWASHPDKVDPADKTPDGSPISTKLDVDVFYLYPTTYTSEKGNDQWNPAIDDAKLNKKTDNTALLYQASAWNHAGRIFAPYYRQAHISSYWTRDKVSAKQAFELAYSDVKAAFSYYLLYMNDGRPIIIVSHSQGSTHAQRLLTEFFDGKPFQKRLVAAYLLGMPLPVNKYKSIPPCEDADDIGCVISWRTFEEGHYPFDKVLEPLIVTNPLSWNRDTIKIEKLANPGSIYYKFNKIVTGNVSAQIHKDILWSNKPRFLGSIFLRTKNFHAGDINFYYMSIRENAVKRAKFYLSQN